MGKIRNSGNQEKKEMGVIVSTKMTSPNPRLWSAGAARWSECSKQVIPAT
jgi:hypothetical protein